MFLRSGIEYNAGLASGVVAVLVLLPYVLVLVQEAASAQFLGSGMGTLADLAPAAAAVGALGGCASLALLGIAYRDWEMRPPLGVIGASCAIALAGLGGTHLAHPTFLPDPWPWVLGGAVLLLAGALFARLMRIASSAE